MSPLPIFNKNFLVLSIILILVCLSYWPALKNDFVLWDDDVHIFNNESIRSLDREHLHRIFTSYVSKIYVPLTELSFAVEYHFFGNSPFIYHFDNILLHLLVVICIFYLSLRLGLSLTGAAVTALIFGLHPVHVESVAWATERKDVLYGSLYMLAVLFYLRYLDSLKVFPARRRLSNLYLFLTTLSGILSMLAKPMAISLPVILLLLDWFTQRKKNFGLVFEKLPLFLILGALGWLTFSLNRHPAGPDAPGSLLLWCWSLAFYIRIFFFPYPLMPVHHSPAPLDLFNQTNIHSLLIVLAVLMMAVYFRKSRWLIFSLGYFFISIFIRLLWKDDFVTFVNDRFIYLPSLGFCFLLGLGFEYCLDSSHKHLFRIRAWLAGLFVLIVLTLGAQTYFQCFVWRNSFSLWRHQLKFTPNEPLALNNLAAAYSLEGNFSEAVPYYKSALKIKPDYIQSQIGLGKSLDKLGRHQEADIYFRPVLAARLSADNYMELAEIFIDLNRLNEVSFLYRKALILRPGDSMTHYNYGNILLKQNRSSEAVIHYLEALRINPIFFDARANLGAAYLMQKKYPQALYHFEQALKIRPASADVYNNIGTLLCLQGRLNEALSAYQKALEINPHFKQADDNLRRTLEELKKIR